MRYFKENQQNLLVNLIFKVKYLGKIKNNNIHL